VAVIAKALDRWKVGPNSTGSRTPTSCTEGRRDRGAVMQRDAQTPIGGVPNEGPHLIASVIAGVLHDRARPCAVKFA
jgi:hypothetical protein